jgi:transposase
MRCERESVGVVLPGRVFIDPLTTGGGGMRCLGLDVHKDFAEVAEALPGGGIRQLGRIRTTPSALRAFAETLGANDQVALEATINTFAIARLLEEHAGRVVISNPLRTRAIADAKIKTDKVDAGVLAQLLAADYLPGVWQPNESTRVLRRLVARRAHIVRQRTRLKNQIHAILLRNLVSGCPASDLFGNRGRAWLQQVPLPLDEREALDSSLRLFDLFGQELVVADEACAKAATGRDDVRRLMTVPGVDFAVALALVAAIGDIHRFGSPQKLVGYFGLDPRVRQSGSQPARTGLHITKVGRAHARGMLVEAAWAVARTPGPLRAFFDRVRARRGPQIAAVALARKLTVLTWHLLTRDQDYLWVRPALLAAKYRRLELRAGVPTRRGQRGAAANYWASTESRARDRALPAAAEADYRRLTDNWIQRPHPLAEVENNNGRGRPKGEATDGQRPDARRRSHPQPPLFSTGVARAQMEDKPAQRA